MQHDFLSAVVLLFLVLDPIGNIPVVLSLLRQVPESRRKRVILRECMVFFGLAYSGLVARSLSVANLVDVVIEVCQCCGVIRFRAVVRKLGSL